jgi:HK97 family phage prohead protease
MNARADIERRRARQEMLMGTPERRNFDADLELRTAGDGKLRLVGYASTTETSYEVRDFTETIARGAFRRTLGESPDVVLLREHEGLPLARTTSGTLQLAEDARGLRVEAILDPSDPDVQSLVPKMQRRDLTEMSLAFRATKQAWSEDRTKRTIRELSIHRGDVSLVTRGANPSTTAELAMRSALARNRRRSDNRGRLDVAKARRAQLGHTRAAYVTGQDGHPKGRYTDDEIQKLGEEGKTLKKENSPRYHYPIVDRRDLQNAIQAYGRAKPSERAGVRAWIVKRAREMHLDQTLPKGWGELKPAFTTAKRNDFRA